MKMPINREELDLDEINAIMAEFLMSYLQKKKETSDRDWLIAILSKYMPDNLYTDIIQICDEIISETEQISNLMEEAIQSGENYGWNAETWLYSKIKNNLSDDDEYLENLAATDQTLTSLVAVMMQSIDENQAMITWHDDKFQRDSLNTEVKKQEKINVKEEISTPSNNSIITTSAFSAGFKKTALAQYQKALRIDLGSVHARNYDPAEAALRISRNAALSGIGSIALTTGFTLMGKMVQGNLKMSQRRLLSMIFQTGADNGIRAAVGGALKVSAERGLLPMLSRATPARTFAAITCIGVENMKILYKYAEGNLTGLQAMEQAGKVSTACVFSIGFALEGAIFGAAAFSVVPIAGPIVGAILGEMVGNVIGGQVGNVFYASVKRLCLSAKYAVLADYDVITQFEDMVAEPLSNRLKRKRRNLLYV